MAGGGGGGRGEGGGRGDGAARGNRGDGQSSTTRPTTRNAADAPTTRVARGAGERTHGVLWVEDGKFVRPVRVRIGATDGVNTEVIADEVKEGQQVVLGEATADSAGSNDTKNPFAPQFRRRPGGR
jgi:HlyD family secretion protein